MENTIIKKNVTDGELAFNPGLYTPPNNITFHNEKGKEVGRLEFGEKGMKFTGNADESAKVFFDHFLKGYVDDYIKDLLKKVK